MKKQRIETFIKKYNLNGLIESVKWEVSDNSLNTSFISDDKSVLGNVKMDGFSLDGGEYGIYDTSKLTKMLSVLENDVDLDLVKANNTAASVTINDNDSSVTYMLSDLSVIPIVPSLKQLPDFDIDINIDDNFIQKFIKAKAALNNENTFTFMCDGDSGNGKIILGYSSLNTNRISISVNCTCGVNNKPLSFSAEFLKEIFIANRDATKSSMKLSSQGLAHLSFEFNGYSSDYYLVEIQN